nr:deoxyribodipyrimidine photo-lyase [Candidatus Sigynarchaeum springense]
MSGANTGSMRVDPRRIREFKIEDLNEPGFSGGPVVYWMSRDQRVLDNWALLHAQDLALAINSPLIVLFCLARDFLGAQARQYWFMLKGLVEVEQTLSKLSIPFFIVQGNPNQQVPAFVKVQGASYLVTDFSPLRVKDEWLDAIKKKIKIPIHEVDAHNIIPCWVASGKQEFSARFFRPKVKRWLPEFFTKFPPVLTQVTKWGDVPRQAVGSMLQQLEENIDDLDVTSDLASPGSMAGSIALGSFIESRLSMYSTGKNDPTQDAVSKFSPYLHFGQISAQRVALSVEHAAGVPLDAKETFLEELIVRRELSDNYCFYNKYYDSFEGFPDWAKKTLDEHRS